MLDFCLACRKTAIINWERNFFIPWRQWGWSNGQKGLHALWLHQIGRDGVFVCTSCWWWWCKNDLPSLSLSLRLSLSQRIVSHTEQNQMSVPPPSQPPPSAGCSGCRLMGYFRSFCSDVFSRTSVVGRLPWQQESISSEMNGGGSNVRLGYRYFVRTVSGPRERLLHANA